MPQVRHKQAESRAEDGTHICRSQLISQHSTNRSEQLLILPLFRFVHQNACSLQTRTHRTCFLSQNSQFTQLEQGGASRTYPPHPHTRFFYLWNMRVHTFTVQRAPAFTSHGKCLHVPTRGANEATGSREELTQRSSKEADWLSTETNCLPRKTTPWGTDSL